MAASHPGTFRFMGGGQPCMITASTRDLRGSCSTWSRWCGELRSLEGDLGAGALESSLRLLGGLLGDLLQDGLRGGVHQVLGLLQAQAGEGAHLLDDLDLLVAGAFEDDVELVLLVFDLDYRAGARRARDGDRSGRGDLELLFELLHEVGELDEGELGERLEQVFGAELRHDGSLSNCVAMCAPD